MLGPAAARWFVYRREWSARNHRLMIPSRPWRQSVHRGFEIVQFVEIFSWRNETRFRDGPMARQRKFIEVGGANIMQQVGEQVASQRKVPEIRKMRSTTRVRAPLPVPAHSPEAVTLPGEPRCRSVSREDGAGHRISAQKQVNHFHHRANLTEQEVSVGKSLGMSGSASRADLCPPSPS